MEILIVLGFIAGIYGLSTMTSESRKMLEKSLSEMMMLVAFGISVVMLALCCFAVWMLIDESSAVAFIFRGAIIEPIFVEEYAFLKWWLFLPMPLMIPWIIYKMFYVLKLTGEVQ